MDGIFMLSHQIETILSIYLPSSVSIVNLCDDAQVNMQN